MASCYDSALRILNVRFNSEAELRRKLLRKKFEKPEIDATIERLRREKWLDDKRFAESFARSRASRGQGRSRIAAGLQAAGVARETVTRAIAEQIDPEAERERLQELAEKKVGLFLQRHGLEGASSDAGRRRLVSFLVRRGFNPSDALEVVDRLLSAASA